MKKWIIGVSVLVAATLIACGSDSKPDDADVNRLNDRVNSSVPTPPDKPVKTQITTGDWEVGKADNLDAGVISPGTYVITALETGNGCYYKAVKNFDDSFESIIVNGNIDPGKTKLLVVKSSYKGLVLENDCLAKKK
jgi:hypothetical protein